MLPGYHYLGGRLGINAVAHQNRTVRFGTDPATSALDLNCKMHDLDNLYVVDSSFFVSSTAVNPTLTIIANALRVADHIAGRLGAAGYVAPLTRWAKLMMMFQSAVSVAAIALVIARAVNILG